VAVHYSVLQSVVECYKCSNTLNIVLLFVTGCCSVLQSVAECCRVLQSVVNVVIR